MTRIIGVLGEFLKEMQNSNPYGLVLKGGTALSLFHLNTHRESEDLDFDSDLANRESWKEIEKYFIGVLKRLKEKGVLEDFKVGKSGLAATSRYHMKLELKTYKTFQTKIDVDFAKLPNSLKRKGKLLVHTKERIFITKIITFINRNEFKDLYDISHLLGKIDINKFKHNKNIANLVEQLINSIEKEDATKLYRLAFRNIDLRFKDLKESEID